MGDSALTKYCGNCGNQVPVTAKVCGRCGHPLSIDDGAGQEFISPSVAGAAARPDEMARVGRFRWTWLVLILLAVAAAAIWLGLSDSGPATVTRQQIDSAGQEISNANPAATAAADTEATPDAQAAALALIAESGLTIADLANPSVVWTDTFQGQIPARWVVSDESASRQTQRGLRLQGRSEFLSRLVGEGVTVRPGQGLAARLRLEGAAEVEVLLESGEWKTDDYLRWGIIDLGEAIAVHNFHGPEYIGGMALTGGTQHFEPDQSYEVILIVLESGRFVTVVAPSDNPIAFSIYSEDMGGTWSEIDWQPHIGVQSGAVVIEQIRLLEH